MLEIYKDCPENYKWPEGFINIVKKKIIVWFIYAVANFKYT